ncbi:hypothetical protein G6O69_38490 [Pseudenhygromyxa sp. WMMC2535]|nr:hypothetical protein [Pseudenhygromyxa sp. WMMC2535]NVB43752.1 hypothetical protein [Pseudenhygromyxa sp. WMMC2535]
MVLPAVDAKALARHVRDQLEAEAPASRPSSCCGWPASSRIPASTSSP